MNIQKLLDQARKNYKIGNSNESIALLKKILAKYPNQPVAHANLGAIYNARKEFQLAEYHFIQSINVAFDGEIFSLLVAMYMQNHLWEKARDLCIKYGTQIKKDGANLLNYAIILRELGDINESISVYQKILSLFPNYIECYVSYGFTFNKIKKYKDAINVYKKGLVLDSNNYRLIYNIGIAYLNQYNYDEALYYLDQALAQNKNSIDLLLTIAVCYAKKRNFKAAIKSIQQAENIDPKNPLVPFQLGTLMMQQEKIEQALMFLNKVLELDPNHIEAKYHIGISYLKLEKYKDGVNFYRYRVLRKEDKLGRFNDFDIKQFDKKTKLIVCWEQGIGDEILYLGLINEMLKQVGSITYIVQDKLFEWARLNLENIELIKDSVSTAYIKEHSNAEKINAASMMCYVNNWQSFFSSFTKWKADNEVKKRFLDTFQTKKKIMGISWMSSNEKIGDEKTIPLPYMSKLFDDDYKIISLQYGDVKNEITKVNKLNNNKIYHINELDYFNDISGLASLVSVCDIVITCSNVTAHIAGRLGIKTFLLLPKYFGNIWYWQTDDNQSKWYPSIKILRQREDGNWDQLINEVKKELV